MRQSWFSRRTVGREIVNEYDRRIVIKEGHGRSPGFNYQACLVIITLAMEANY